MQTKKLSLMTAVTVLGLIACGRVSAASLSAQEVIASVNTADVLTSAYMVQIQAVHSDLPTRITNFVPVLVLPTLAPATLIQPSNTPILYTPSGNCDSALYIKDVTISDGAIFTPNTTFKKIWRIRNTGSCIWNKNYAIMFSSGNNMSGETTTINRQIVPNETADISVELTAPDNDGTYTGYWILSKDNGVAFGGVAFGGFVYVQIVVSTNTSASPLAPTTTLESTATIAPTNTTEPTAIPATEEIPTPTKEPTSN